LHTGPSRRAAHLTEAAFAGSPEGGWEAKAHEHDGSDFDQVVTATIGADPADRFAYGLQLLIDGIRAQLAG
jgi:hypothetical protein